ncbi:hypothetical protein AB0I28_32335 [Phytomonospora sp. NPDC050363]|uniref:hypothetical protein n=1 Tax=Phytomonospora sp. NPDC050363 TaxID=3155642 RepID=UPI0034020E0D
MPARHGSPSRHQWTPASRYNAGDRDLDAAAGHAQQMRTWRHNTHPLTPAAQAAILALLTDGTPLDAVCELTDVSHQAIHGRSAWDADWRTRLNAALMAGRDPRLRHGREETYRHARCRCPECREAHNALR